MDQAIAVLIVVVALLGGLIAAFPPLKAIADLIWNYLKLIFKGPVKPTNEPTNKTTAKKKK